MCLIQLKSFVYFLGHGTTYLLRWTTSSVETVSSGMSMTTSLFMLVKIVFIVSARCLALAWRLQLDAAAEREHKPHRQTQQEHHKAHQQQQLHRPLRSQCVMETASRLCCLAQAASCSCLLNCSEADKFYCTHHRVAYNVSLCKATYE